MEKSKCCGAERVLHNFPKEPTCGNCGDKFEYQEDCNCECHNEMNKMAQCTMCQQHHINGLGNMPQP